MGQLEKITVSEDGKEYSLLQAILRAAPEQAQGPDHSLIKALLNAEVSPSRYDVWKAAVEMKLPDMDVEKFFPVVGDIMARLREKHHMDDLEDALIKEDIAEAERRAEEAEKKAMALLERIERKEDELLAAAQQLKQAAGDGSAAE